MLTENDIKSELSYSYVHAVAARAGFGCVKCSREKDNNATDAEVSEDDRELAEGEMDSSFDLQIQLKATSNELRSDETHWSFDLPVGQYDKLRSTTVGDQRLLVVLRLPREPEEWLSHSDEALIARRCAWWVSLRGAAASGNSRTQTVYIPRVQRFSPEALIRIMASLSRRQKLLYAP